MYDSWTDGPQYLPPPPPPRQPPPTGRTSNGSWWYLWFLIPLVSGFIRTHREHRPAPVPAFPSPPVQVVTPPRGTNLEALLAGKRAIRNEARRQLADSNLPGRAGGNRREWIDTPADLGFRLDDVVGQHAPSDEGWRRFVESRRVGAPGGQNRHPEPPTGPGR